MSRPPPRELAQIAYAAYGEATGGLNYRGHPMPAWEDTGHTIQHAWVAAASAVDHAHHESVVLVVDLDPIHQRLARIERAITTKGNRIMSALDDLRAADEALKAEVTEFLQNIAGRLDGASEADVQAVADDINAEVARLQGADPGPRQTGGETG